MGKKNKKAKIEEKPKVKESKKIEQKPNKQDWVLYYLVNKKWQVKTCFKNTSRRAILEEARKLAANDGQVEGTFKIIKE